MELNIRQWWTPLTPLLLFHLFSTTFLALIPPSLSLFLVFRFLFLVLVPPLLLFPLPFIWVLLLFYSLSLYFFLLVFEWYKERQVGSFFEKTSGYGPNSDASIAEMNNRLVGNKRHNADPTFMASPRESFPQMMPETSNVMKMLRSANGPLHGVRQMRPVPTSFMLQSTGNASNLVKLDRLIPMNVGRASSQAYQVPLSRSKDGSSGPSVLSQLAADEGSRTGNKGSALFSSINASNGAPVRNSSVMLTKPGTQISIPESSNPPSCCGQTSSTRQMTIIFGGQVHVFDDVHPNKADIIMALAGSSGGSWCTNLPKSLTAATMHDLCSPIIENEASVATDSPLSQQYHKAGLSTKTEELPVRQ